MSLLTLFIFSVFVLSGCGVQKTPQKNNQQIKKEDQKQTQTRMQQEEKVVSEDTIEFSEPGDDDLGKEVQELDALINETVPSEYSEDDLSVDSLEVELQ